MWSLFYTKKIPFLPTFFNYLNRLMFSVWFPSSVKYGRNLVLGYGGLGIVIHNRVVIGDDCHIDQNVTLGGTSKIEQVPILGNSIYIGAGAKIIGPVKIGNNVVIGANAVVIKDIPDNSLVVGVPGKVVKTGIYKSDYV